MEILIRLLTHPNRTMKLFRLGKNLTANLSSWEEVDDVVVYLEGHLNDEGKLGVGEGSTFLSLLGMLGRK